ncbi:hypothetical protein RYX36_013791 [Vicia faba]
MHYWVVSTLVPWFIIMFIEWMDVYYVLRCFQLLKQKELIEAFEKPHPIYLRTNPLKVFLVFLSLISEKALHVALLKMLLCVSLELLVRFTFNICHSGCGDIWKLVVRFVLESFSIGLIVELIFLLNFCGKDIERERRRSDNLEVMEEDNEDDEVAEFDDCYGFEFKCDKSLTLAFELR